MAYQNGVVHLESVDELGEHFFFGLLAQTRVGVSLRAEGACSLRFLLLMCSTVTALAPPPSSRSKASVTSPVRASFMRP